MNLALWIAAGLLAVVALGGGISKTFVPQDKLAAARGGGWTADVSGGFLRLTGGDRQFPIIWPRPAEGDGRPRRVMIMRVFVAGGSGVLGQRLVSQLVARDRQVTATTTSEAKLGLLAGLGAEGVVMDGLDAMSVGEAVAMARPDAIVHQMTAISMAHAGRPDIKHIDRWFTQTNRLRTEGTDHLLAAAEATGVSHVVAQSHGSWNGIRQGGWVKTEQDPLDPEEGTAARAGAAAIRHVEEVVVEAGGAALRYGGL